MKPCRFCGRPASYEIEWLNGDTPRLSYVCELHLLSETVAAIRRDPRGQIVTTKIGE